MIIIYTLSLLVCSQHSREALKFLNYLSPRKDAHKIET